jgi:eukaryotic-like serine/threonine-protein kinase
MLQDRWKKIGALFDEALALSPERRTSFLEETCGDPGLRQEVESLLNCYDQSSDFLARPAADHLGRTFGPYRVLREISRGGMGIVYLAERMDRQFEKQVAVKVIPELFLPAATRRSIETEVAILAGLEHSNIARLLDAGITLDGLRWIVMEFIDGPPLDRFVDDQAISERERLTLFQKVCAAVQYLHGSLIVHRDLKPSNILVTKNGEPKVVDFGIARVSAPTGSTANFTQAATFSPGYASPEQLAGKRTTTAADVFSLGAVLYEVLTQKPFRARDVNWDETARSAESQAKLEGLGGDLRLIVGKAVRPEPNQRYVSAAALSDDIRRYLSGEPILARPDSTGYRLRRFGGRHRWAVGAGVAAAMLCSAAVIAILNESRLAERRFALMREFSRGVLWDLSGKLPDLAGNRGFRREMLQTGIRYLDTLSREAGRDNSLFIELATGYAKAGDGLSSRASGLSPDPAGATENYSKAIVFAQRIQRSTAEWEEAQNVFISASAGLGAIKKDQRALQSALTYARARHDQDKSSVARARVLADVEHLSTKGVLGYQQALAAVEDTYRVKPGDAAAQRLYFDWAARRTVTMLFTTPETVWKIFEPAAPIGRNLVAAHPADHATAYLFANALSAASWSHAHGTGGDLSLARQQILESIAVFNKFIPEDPTDYDYRAYSAMARMGLSAIEIRSGNHQAAIEAALEGLDIMKPFAGTRHESSDYRMAMGGLHVHAARAYQLARRMVPACSHYQASDRFYGHLERAPSPFYVELFGFVAEGKAACSMP